MGVDEGVLSLNKIRPPYITQVCGGAAPEPAKPAAQRRTLRIGAGSLAADGGHQTDNGPTSHKHRTYLLTHSMVQSPS